MSVWQIYIGGAKNVLYGWGFDEKEGHSKIVFNLYNENWIEKCLLSDGQCSVMSHDVSLAPHI